MKSTDLREEAAPPSVQEAQAALKAAREAERERKKQLEREREEERRGRTELLKQAQAVVAGVRQQCDDAVSFAEQNPPHPNHFTEPSAGRICAARWWRRTRWTPPRGALFSATTRSPRDGLGPTGALHLHGVKDLDRGPSANPFHRHLCTDGSVVDDE